MRSPHQKNDFAVLLEGTHLLLQMRTRVLNGELEQMFRDWHPGFRARSDEKLNMAA